MARLAETTPLLLAGTTVQLRPSLRAALRLARTYGTFGPVLSGIQEGSVTIMGRVIGECGIESLALADLFTLPGRSLASRIAELRPIALNLVFGLLGIDPDAEQTPADKTAKPADLVEGFEDLFGFATGILRWTPADAWAATPGEIIAAANARQKAFGKKEDDKPDHSTLTLDQQAMLLSARLDTRAS